MVEPQVRTVLVADDDEGTRSLVQLTLGNESYQVLEAQDTASALQAVAGHRPDLILLDAELPGVGGLRICGSVKSQPETRHAKVVLLVDRTSPVDPDEGEQAGVDDYLPRPFTSFGLLKKVGELLGHGSA